MDSRVVKCNHLSMGFAMSIPLSLGSLSAESEIGVVMENLEFAEDRVLVVLSNKETKSFRNYTKTASPIIFMDFNGMVGQCKGLKHFLL